MPKSLTVIFFTTFALGALRSIWPWIRRKYPVGKLARWSPAILITVWLALVGSAYLMISGLSFLPEPGAIQISR